MSSSERSRSNSVIVVVVIIFIITAPITVTLLCSRVISQSKDNCSPHCTKNHKNRMVILYGFLVVISLIKKRLRTTSLSVIQQLSQLPLLHAIRYTTNRSILHIYRVHYLTDAKYSAEVRPNFGTLSAPSAKTSVSAEHCKGMFGAPLLVMNIN